MVLGFFQKLKLRGSIGTTGSQPPRAYAGVASYQYVLDRTYSGLFGLQLRGMQNDDLLWQRKFDKNVGLEMEMFNKLMLVVDVYESTTENSVVFNTIAPSTGFSRVDENVGKVENKGIDLRATYKLWNLPSERSYWNISLSASHNQNIIKELSDAMKNYNEMIDKLYEDENRETMRPFAKVLRRCFNDFHMGHGNLMVLIQHWDRKFLLIGMEPEPMNT